MAHSHGITPEQLRKDNPYLGELARFGPIALGIGILLIAAGFVMNGGEAQQRFYFSYIHNYVFFMSISIGALLFTLVNHVARASWSVVIRRIPEFLAGSLWMMFFAGIPILLLVNSGNVEVYQWVNIGQWIDAAEQQIVHNKEAYLNTMFFNIRFVMYFVVFFLFGRALLLSNSLKQDNMADGDEKDRGTLRVWQLSAPGLLINFLVMTFFAIDLIMSLDPIWFSTMFGVYYFAGAMIGFFSTMILIFKWLQSKGRLKEAVTVEHYHDFGKFLFAFVFFWGYIAFSQYMLIWYASIPEETRWFHIRQNADWTPLAWFMLFGHFALPFAFLISRYIKRHNVLLAVGAVWMLVLHWLDHFYQVIPEYQRITGSAVGGGLPFAFSDILCLLAIGFFWFGCFLITAGKNPIAPLGDPQIAKSLKFDNVKV
ncbi:MAG: hypothetical protein R3F46_09540 [bacterium]